MMKRIGMVAGGGLWFVVAFWIVYRMTFPSQAIADRVSWEVQERSSYALSLDSTHPWWVGLGGTGATLSTVDKRSGKASPMLSADAVRARISPFGLLSGSYRVSGDVTMGEGGVDFYVDAANGDRGTEVMELDIEAVGFPIDALPPVSGFSLEGRGGFDVDVELDAADGMGKADGHLRLGGKDVIIENVPEAAVLLKQFDVFPLVMDELDVDVEFVGGKGVFEAGRLATTLATVELSGGITLANRIARSKCAIDIDLQVTEAMPAPVLSLLGSAKQPDGSYKYEMRGVCGRAMPQPVRKKPARRPNRAPKPGAGGPAAARRPAAAGGRQPAGARATTPTADLSRGRPAGALSRIRPDAGEPIQLDEDVAEDEELDDEELDAEGEADPSVEELVPSEY